MPSFSVCVHKSEIMTPLYILSAAWIITVSWINNQSQHILLHLLIRKSISLVQNITTKNDQSITYGLCWNVGGLGSLAIRARVDRVLYSKKITSFSQKLQNEDNNLTLIFRIFWKFSTNFTENYTLSCQVLLMCTIRYSSLWVTQTSDKTDDAEEVSLFDPEATHI